MNVLSLFDGMSCGQIALNRAGIKYDNYFSSEIKKHAIETTQLNYPGTIQLGDVKNIDLKSLPKIDLLIGGSPCQDLSQAHPERKGLKGEKSSLFFEYERVLKELKPKNFFLENVIMKPEEYSIISECLKIEPVRINSSLVSAQLRDRLYWSNIGREVLDMFGSQQTYASPIFDKMIFLKDILTSGYTDREKSRVLLESDSRPHNLKSQDKMWHRYNSTGFTTVVFDSPDLDWKKGLRYLDREELERLQTVPGGYTKNLTRNKAASLLGDGWTIDIIAHFFKGLKNETI